MATGPFGLPRRQEAARGVEPRQRGGDRRPEDRAVCYVRRRALSLRGRDHQRRQDGPDQSETEGTVDRGRHVRAALRSRRRSRSVRTSPIRSRSPIDPKRAAGLRRGQLPGPDRGDRHQQLTVIRTLSVSPLEGDRDQPGRTSAVTPDGCRLLSADSGEDAIAIFALRHIRSAARSGAAAVTGPAMAERILNHEGRAPADLVRSAGADEPAGRRRRPTRPAKRTSPPPARPRDASS